MAAAIKYTLVDRVSQCRRIVGDLFNDDVISADAEGVHLGMEGPLTLLQVGRSDGHVILFDIQSGGKEMFTDGRLKELLASDKVLKVMHGSSNDSVALHSQFGVDLGNVFDIQVAHMTREKQQGRQLPSRMKLGDLCSVYLDDTSMLDKKDDIQIKWNKTDGEYWAMRPMTSEMIDYACADIGLLIPVYMKQKRILHSSGLWQQFQRDIEIELRFRWDEAVREEENKKRDAIAADIFISMEKKYRGEPNIEEINDEDELQALKRTFIREVDNLSPTIRKLKFQQVKQEVEEIRDEMEKEGANYVPKQMSIRVLSSSQDHPDEAVKTLAGDLLTRCNTILKNDMAVKYTLSTPLKHTTVTEQRMLRRLKPKSATDSDYRPVVLRLYWNLMQQDLDKDMESFAKDRAAYAINEGHVKKVKFYMSGDGVPRQLKDKARVFISDLQNYGKITRPSRGGRGRGRRY